MTSPLSGPRPPDDAGRVQPVRPVAPVRDVPSKPKDPPLPPKKKRAILHGAEVELIPEAGDPVMVPIAEFAARYRELFGEDPPAGALLDERA